MNVGRCPCCHAPLDLGAIVADLEARDLLALLTTYADLARPLVGYLTLWRPAKRDLSWGRALKLAREVVALSADAAVLAEALAVTVDSLRAKGGELPITSHGYLKRVLEAASTRAQTAVDGGSRAVAVTGNATAGSSKTLKALAALEALKGGAGHD